MTLKNAVDLPKIENMFNGLTRPLMNYMTHFQIRLSNLIVKMKCQTVHLQSLFQLEVMVLLNLMKMMSQVYQSLIQREHPPSISFVELDDAPVANNSASVTNSYNPDEPNLNIYDKASKFGNTNLAVYAEQTKSPVNWT